MAAVSSSTVTASLSVNPTSARKFTSLSSPSSVSFSYNISNRAGLSVDLPRRAKKRGLSCTCLFGLGVPELVVIAGVAALVFGPKKLPEVGRSIGKTVKSFQQAAKEFETELKKDGEPVAEPSSETITTVSEETQQEAQVPLKESS
ncbi:sec-independent protein translocase protein tata chloroplastic [Phtheirospermum japonicum]|uniref:Sec-independent protein translocase protein tata chloroplastic n=1 Tax=Phtheirospermum japonicum TaxID=374723 RepID=A0A830BAV1_9LAMI|nr:sec-independent protein translocase protein tata chloroplastic [Phtheirospermum japonicum]